MAKSKTRTETEFLRGRVRELEAEMKKLRKIASRSAKKATRLESLVDEKTEEEMTVIEKQFEKPVARCPDCNSKNYEVFDLGIRELHVCEDCGHRKAYPKKK